MCIAKSPKVTTTEQRVKDPTVIRNPYLDGTGPQIKALRTGRSSLRIERTGRGAAPAAPPVLPAPDTSVLPPYLGGGTAPDVRFGGIGGGGGIGNIRFDGIRVANY